MPLHIDFPLTGYADLPVLRVCAGSAAARRTYIEQLMHALTQQALTSTCIKQNKSSQHPRDAILALVRRYDLVIIDEKTDEPAQQPEISRGDYQTSIDQISRRMDTLVRQTPVWACILIGGKSFRMGQPKHLIEDSRKITWLEKEMKVLAPLVDEVVVSGAGRLPDNLSGITRLDDIPGVAGPLTGIVSAIRYQPMVSWLLVACDMPHFSTDAIHWLLMNRHAGCWGVVPQLAGSTRAEPLLAWYDFRAGQIFEEQLVKKNLRISDVAAHPKIDTPLIPENLRQSWQNINTPAQLSAVLGQNQQDR